MGRTYLLGAMLVMAAAPTAASPERPDFTGLAKSIDSAVADKGLPSVVAVVFDEHHILWSHVAGYSDAARKISPTLRTRYRLGSMAKSVTSTALAIAEQKGLVSLDRPVQVRTAEGSTRLPLRNLVNMRAGLAQAVCYDGIAGEAVPDCDGTFDRRFGVSMTAGAGRYSYSNMGPQLAADALTVRDGKPFEQLARELLFSPAGLNDMTYDHSRSAASRAIDYDGQGKLFDHDFRISPAAGAGLEASAEDLVRYGELHLTGRAPNGRRLLSPRTLALLHSAPNDGFYGYGWGRIGAGKATEVLISDGQVNGGQAMLLINPSARIGAIVMSNAAHDEVSELALKALDAVVPGTSAAFAADVDKAQGAHVAKVARFLPPADFKASGFVRVGERRLPIIASVRANSLAVTIAGETSEQKQSEADEGLRGWSIPCPHAIPACARPDAEAKLWLSRDSGELGGQLQVRGLDGELPYPVRLRLH